MPALSPRRVERARPHWLVIDEAHQLLPSEWDGFAVFTQRALDIRAATGRNRPEKVAVLDRGVERVLRTYGLRRIGPQELEGECAEAAVRWPFRGFSRWRHSEAGDVVDITVFRAGSAGAYFGAGDPRGRLREWASAARCAS